MQAAGFVLVGGRSSRMGRDKALLPLNAHAVIEDVAEKVRKVAGNVVLVGRPERYRDLALEGLPDIRSGLGPLAGIEAALAARRAKFNLIVACDLPGLDSRWLYELLQRARETDAICVAVRDRDGRAHPLCAVYRGECLERVQRVLDEGRLRAQDFVRELEAEFVEIDAVVENVNTPQEWASWVERHAQRVGG